MIKNRFQFSIILLFVLGCAPKKADTFTGLFEGYWGETEWYYRFYRNNTFKFKCNGHYDNLESKGRYRRNKDSLFLFSTDTVLRKEGIINSLYLITNDSCVLDVDMDYQYCQSNTWRKFFF